MNAPAILLVEDSQDDAELATRALRQAGISNPVDLARDGEEAIEYLTKRPLPLLVLLDLSLPKVGGFEVLRRIRAAERTRLVPTVVLSSSDVREDIERAYQLGANSYVCKPVEFSTYSAAVRQLARYWIDLNQPLRSAEDGGG